MSSRSKINYYSSHLRSDEEGNFYCLYHPSQRACFVVDNKSYNFECLDCGIKGTISDFVKIIEPEANLNRFNN